MEALTNLINPVILIVLVLAGVGIIISLSALILITFFSRSKLYTMIFDNSSYKLYKFIIDNADDCIYDSKYENHYYFILDKYRVVLDTANNTCSVFTHGSFSECLLSDYYKGLNKDLVSKLIPIKDKYISLINNKYHTPSIIDPQTDKYYYLVSTLDKLSGYWIFLHKPYKNYKTSSTKAAFFHHFSNNCQYKSVELTAIVKDEDILLLREATEEEITRLNKVIAR